MEQIASRVAYANAWMTVREDTVRRTDGTTGSYGVVDKPDFALVIPRTSSGFWLVDQYRYPVRRRAWEFPQGSWGGRSQGSAAELARTELAEETGLTAGRLRHLGHLHGAYGFCSQGFDVFLAEDLVSGPTRREPAEADMIHRHVREQEFREMVVSGQIVDAATLSAYALLLLAAPE